MFLLVYPFVMLHEYTPFTSEDSLQVTTLIVPNPQSNLCLDWAGFDES